MTEKQKLCRIVTIICHYDTIISLITIIIPIITKKDFFSAWHSLKKRGLQHPPSQGISVSSKQKHNRLNLGAPRCPLADRHQGRRCPGRPFGCRKASLRSWQDETDRPSHQRFGNSRPFVLPHLICKSKILTHLAIIRIISISVIIVSNAKKCIISITFSAWVSVLNPICQKMSSIKWTIFLFNMKIFFTTVPFTL
jgi:hypothetical protein